jgi:hypothetical protein
LNLGRRGLRQTIDDVLLGLEAQQRFRRQPNAWSWADIALRAKHRMAVKRCSSVKLPTSASQCRNAVTAARDSDRAKASSPRPMFTATRKRSRAANGFTEITTRASSYRQRSRRADSARQALFSSRRFPWQPGATSLPSPFFMRQVSSGFQRLRIKTIQNN